MRLSLYNYIFYCYYRVFKLLKRDKDIDHLLASRYLSIISTFNILTILTASGFFKLIFGKIPLAIPIICLFVFTYYFNLYYFIKKDYYQKVIKQYEGKVFTKTSISLSIIITVMTLLVFCITGWLVDQAE